MGVRVGTLSLCRVRESWLCPSARLCESLLQLKHVTVKVCARCFVSCVHILVERPGCGQRGFGAMPKADGGRRSYRKARMCAGSRRRDYCKQVQRSMVRTECEDRNSGGTYVRTGCGRPINGGGKA